VARQDGPTVRNRVEKRKEKVGLDLELSRKADLLAGILSPEKELVLLSGHRAAWCRHNFQNGWKRGEGETVKIFSVHVADRLLPFRRLGK